MKAAFIISEYNPFHNGHVYHIEITKKDLSPDAIVCVMSGNFTQRGSAAIVDKWCRAKMALLSGADLVLELHPVYATASADIFAVGAVQTINALGVSGWLSFGAESEKLPLLSALAEIIQNETESFQERIAINLRKGYSFAKSRALAIADCYCSQSDKTENSEDIARLLKLPNNILALEYMKSIKTTNAKIIPHAIKRTENNYHDLFVTGSIASATAIRNTLNNPHSNNPKSSNLHSINPCSNNSHLDNLCSDNSINMELPEPVLNAMPESAAQQLLISLKDGKGPTTDSDYFIPLLTILRRMTPEQIRMFDDVSEGLENRILAAAKNNVHDYESFLESICSKRFPKSRIRRILTKILLGIDSVDTETLNLRSGPPYLRVLGFNDRGQKLLAYAKKETAKVPIVVKFANTKQLEDERAQRFAGLEAQTTDIYVTGYQNPLFRYGSQDYLTNVIRI